MPTTDIEIRRRRVSELLARNRTPGEIAEELGVSRQTVRRDISALEEEIRALQRGDPEAVTAFIARVHANLDAVRAEAWELADDCEELSVRLGALAEARQSDGKLVDILATLGVVGDEDELRGGTENFQFVVQSVSDDAEDADQGSEVE